MTEKEAEIILVESLLHSKETRVDYYYQKAKELNTGDANFFHALNNAYKRLEEYVNSTDYSWWSVDEKTGEKVFSKKNLNMLYMGSDVIGTLTYDNLGDLLLPSLAEFGEIVLARFEASLPLDLLPPRKPQKQNKIKRFLSYIWSLLVKASKNALIAGIILFLITTIIGSAFFRKKIISFFRTPVEKRQYYPIH